MTVRKALVFYGVALMAVLVGSWLVAAYYDWRAGMALMTALVIEHAWRAAKQILRNGR